MLPVPPDEEEEDEPGQTEEDTSVKEEIKDEDPDASAGRRGGQRGGRLSAEALQRQQREREKKERQKRLEDRLTAEHALKLMLTDGVGKRMRSLKEALRLGKLGGLQGTFRTAEGKTVAF